jgi:hypothetical protein
VAQKEAELAEAQSAAAQVQLTLAQNNPNEAI